MNKTVIVFFLFLMNFITVSNAADNGEEEKTEKSLNQKIVVMDDKKKSPGEEVALEKKKKESPLVFFRFWTIQVQLDAFKKSYPDATHIQGMFNDKALEAVVEAFPKMENLFLSGGKVRTLKPLANLKSLHSLSLKDTYLIFNKPKEYQYLVSLPLYTVCLFNSNTIIPKFDALKALPFLEELTLCGSDNNEVNFDSLVLGFPTLKVLKIQKCNDIIGRGDPTLDALHNLKNKRPSLKILYLFLITNYEIT